MDYQERSLGAYVNLEHLAAYQLAAKHLTLKKNRALNQLSGPYKAIVRGRGMEFEDVRQYQAGDDIRSIDWRVTARTGKAHTKQFREEREKPVLIVVDQRQTMFFGSQFSMKSVLAADYASYIAWAAFHKGDRVGGLVFNNSSHREIRPRRQRKTVMQLLHHITDYNAQLNTQAEQQTTDLLTTLLEVKRVAKPGTQIFLISDFHDLQDEAEILIYDLSRHCEITAIQIYDPLEERLPKADIYKVTNGIDNIQFDTRNRHTRKYYLDQFSSYKDRVQRIFNKFGIPVLVSSTADEPLPILQHYFGKS